LRLLISDVYFCVIGPQRYDLEAKKGGRLWSKAGGPCESLRLHPGVGMFAPGRRYICAGMPGYLCPGVGTFVPGLT
jgi:hypothetical protein